MQYTIVVDTDLQSQWDEGIENDSKTEDKRDWNVLEDWNKSLIQ